MYGRRWDRWAADPATRVVAITGLGGLGKDGPNRALAEVWWRGYSQGCAIHLLLEVFLRQSIDERLAQKTPEIRPEDDRLPAVRRKDRPVEEARELLRASPSWSAVTGLLLLQESQVHVDFGMFLDNDLRDFLHRPAVSTTPRPRATHEPFPLP